MALANKAGLRAHTARAPIAVPQYRIGHVATAGSLRSLSQVSFSDRSSAMQRPNATSSPEAATETSNTAWQPSEPTYICSSVTADTVEGFLAEIEEATAAGVDVIELRLDFIKDFNPSTDLKPLVDACKVPYIVTFRPTWEGCVRAAALLLSIQPPLCLAHIQACSKPSTLSC